MNTYGPLFDNLSGGLIAVQPLAVKARPIADSAQTGQQLKEKGIKEVSEHNENWMEACINFMYKSG